MIEQVKKIFSYLDYHITKFFHHAYIIYYKGRPLYIFEDKKHCDQHVRCLLNYGYTEQEIRIEKILHIPYEF